MKKIKYAMFSFLLVLPLLVTPALAAVDNAPPSAPANLTASLNSSGQVNLNWTSSVDNVGVIGYIITRNNNLLNISNSTSTSFLDTTVSPNTTYSYTVKAFDTAGNVSADSNNASIITPIADTVAPSIPTNLVASLNAVNQVNLNWTASTDNFAVTGYAIMRNGSLIGNSTTTNFLDVSVLASTTYSYTVKAFDAAGNVSAESNIALITTPASTDTTAPSAPTNLSASLNSSNKVNLNWTASTDNVAVSGYTIMRNNSVIGTSTTNSFLDNGVSASTTYSYVVKAFDTAGNTSTPSNTVIITTLNSNNNGGDHNPGSENESENGLENEKENGVEMPGGTSNEKGIETESHNNSSSLKNSSVEINNSDNHVTTPSVSNSNNNSGNDHVNMVTNNSRQESNSSNHSENNSNRSERKSGD